MKVLFLTLLDFYSYNERNIYCDLLREFIKNGDEVYCISPVERKNKKNIKSDEKIIKPIILNIQKANIFEKTLSTLLIENQFIHVIKKYLGNIHFDLVLYSTPPITFANIISFIKKRDNARAYLLLKDIFPQNAVDLGMLSKTGWKGVIYRYFRRKEKKLYALSDKIGCMSPANMEYVLKHNPEIPAHKVEVCPNCIDVQDLRLSEEERMAMRAKCGIPQDKIVFVYGGNLGRPQGIPFIIECLEAQKNNKQVYFLIVGDGTEYGKLEGYINKAKPHNVTLMKRLPKDDYDRMIAACDVGMIFLDHRFTIPNFPSRLLSYMQAGLPVFACTDKNTDIGKIITENKFGWWCESNDIEEFNKIISEIEKTDISNYADTSYRIIGKYYSSKHAYGIIKR